MAARKTISVGAVVDAANHVLKNGTNGREFREGVISLVEQVLRETDQYNGYFFLTKDMVPKDQAPGIEWVGLDGQLSENIPESTARFPDDTRRHYYIKKA